MKTLIGISVLGVACCASLPLLAGMVAIASVTVLGGTLVLRALLAIGVIAWHRRASFTTERRTAR